jgi:hypothetical protein
MHTTDSGCSCNRLGCCECNSEVEFWRQSAHCTNAQQRHDFGVFFSDLASKNFELLARLDKALKNAKKLKTFDRFLLAESFYQSMFPTK